MHHLAHTLLRQWKKVALVGLATAALAAGVSFAFPLEYRADADVLIISRSQFGVDPYTTVKSAERIGENLARIVGTNDFFQKVAGQSGYTLNLSRFQGVTERVKRKRWARAVQASVVYNTGVLTVSAFGASSDEAKALSGAAAAALVEHAGEYVGGNVNIKVLNDAVATRFPVRPNMLANAVLGFVVGIALGAWWMGRRRPMFGG